MPKAAALAQPDVPLEPGTDTWRLAGAIDQFSRGGTVFATDAAKLVPVLDGIEAGQITPPERATRNREPSKKSEVVHALEAAAAEKSLTGKNKLIAEALDLLGVTTK